MAGTLSTGGNLVFTGAATGEWLETNGALITSENPTTGEALATVRSADEADYDAVLRAAEERFLEWRPEARLPMEGQGDQLLLGKSTKSFTSVEHRYEEEKPVFHILRTNDKDTAIIKISEGALMLRVKQEK